MGIRCANHLTPLYPQKLALTSPTGGGRSVGMVRSRTKATEFSFSLVLVSLMYEFKIIGKLFLSKYVGTGPSSYEKSIYRTAVSQRLRNTGLTV